MAYDEDLVFRIRELVHDEEGLTEQKMFGGLAFLIHGHGTGALREAVRETLRTSAYVARTRPGQLSLFVVPTDAPGFTKQLLPVGGRPFLDTLIDEIARYDVFEEILLLAGHKAESIEARYAGTARGRARLKVSLEQAPLGTAGALVHAAPLLQERFLLLNGDSFFDFNILDLAGYFVSRHRQRRTTKLSAPIPTMAQTIMR